MKSIILQVGCLAILTRPLLANEETVTYAYPMNDPQDASSWHILQMVQWLNDMEDGFFNPKIQIRRSNPEDPTSYFGVFAAEDLEQDEMLLYIPPDARIYASKKYGDYTDTLCDLAWTLKQEFDLGYKSDYKHYVHYLQEQRRDIIPAVWSKEAQELLMKVQDELYMKDYEPKTVHASHLVNWIEEWFQEPCLMKNPNKNEKQSLHAYFLAVVTQRGFDNMLVPVYDFFNHHSGNVNIYNRNSIYHRNGFDVYASRPIKAGEELFFAYGSCADYDSSNMYWGTPEMLRDFGFVEPYPQTFYLGDYMTFVVSNATVGTKEPSLKDLSIEYKDHTYPTFEIFEEAKREIVRLERVYQMDILNADTTKIAPHELYTITEYYKALSKAFKVMVITFDPEIAAKWEDENEEEGGGEGEEEEEMCEGEEEEIFDETNYGEEEYEDEDCSDEDGQEQIWTNLNHHHSVS